MARLIWPSVATMTSTWKSPRTGLLWIKNNGNDSTTKKSGSRGNWPKRESRNDAGNGPLAEIGNPLY